MPDPTTPITFSTLTLVQFCSANVEAILDAHPNLTLNNLQHPLRDAVEVAEAEAQHAHAAILRLMSDICSMWLQPAVATAPLTYAFNWGESPRLSWRPVSVSQVGMTSLLNCL